MSSSFFQKLLNFLNLDVSKSLKSLWDFLTSIGSFQGLPAEALEVILLPQRLALKYNTTHRAIWQPLFASFFDFFLLWAFCPVFCIKLHRRLTSSRPCIPCLPPDSFLPYYKVIYNKGDPIWEPYREQRILPCGKVLLFLCGLSRGFDRDFALKIFPQICSMLQNTKCSGSSIDISLNSDMIVSTSTMHSAGASCQKGRPLKLRLYRQEENE